jgi:hypothetical protein
MKTRTECLDGRDRETGPARDGESHTPCADLCSVMEESLKSFSESARLTEARG